MKIILLTLILIVASASQGDANEETVPEMDEVVPQFDAIRDTVFLVFTRQNPTIGQIVDISDMWTVRNSFFDSRRETKFLVHGMLGNRNSSMNTIIQPAYLQAGDFSNFFI